jgi:hypothetical protein
MTFIFAPGIAMDAVYRDDNGNEATKMIVGFAAEGPQVIDSGEGKTIITCTKAAPYGFKFMGLTARLMDPSGWIEYGEDQVDQPEGELGEAPPPHDG